MEKQKKLYKELLAQPFDFTVDETVISDPKKLHFLKTESERKDAWRKRLKYLVLDRYVDLVETQEKIREKKILYKKVIKNWKRMQEPGCLQAWKECIIV